MKDCIELRQHWHMKMAECMVSGGTRDLPISAVDLESEQAQAGQRAGTCGSPVGILDVERVQARHAVDIARNMRRIDWYGY
jgi:hypothetical protein